MQLTSFLRLFALAPQVNDDPAEEDYNVDEWLEKVVSFAKFQAEYFETNHIMWTLGSDFNFVHAENWFRNLDKLIHYAKQNNTVNLLYSSPSHYVREKVKQSMRSSEAQKSYSESKQPTSNGKKIVWELRRDDVFPISDGPHQYWSGYFTSRPSIKKIIRKGFSILNAARQIEALELCQWQSGTSRKIDVLEKWTTVGESYTDELEASVSVAVHHDGITGTEKQTVSNDYTKRIYVALKSMERKLSSSLHQLAMGSALGEYDSSQRQRTTQQFGFCFELNVSKCNNLIDAISRSADNQIREAEATTGIVLGVWNALSSSLATTLSVPVLLSERIVGYNLMDVATKTLIQTQMVPIGERTLNIATEYLNTHGLSLHEKKEALQRLRNQASHEMHFKVSLPAVGMRLLKLVPITEASTGQTFPFQGSSDHFSSWSRYIVENGRALLSTFESEKRTLESKRKASVLENRFYHLDVGSLCRTGEVAIERKLLGSAFTLRVDFGFYLANEGDLVSSQASGAYIMRTVGQDFFSLFGAGSEEGASVDMIHGDVVQLARCTVSDWVSFDLKLYNDEAYFEVEYTVGPVPLHEHHGISGKEVVVRYFLDGFKNDGVFYTDSNGRAMIRREVNARPSSYPALKTNEAIAQNYYPVTSHMRMEDAQKGLGFSVVTDTSQAGGSVFCDKAELELLLHRRLVHDDARGVQEPLNETMCGCSYQAENNQCDCSGLIIRGKHQLILSSTEETCTLSRKLSNRFDFQPLVFFGKSSLSTAAQAAVQERKQNIELPENVQLLTLTATYSAVLKKHFQRQHTHDTETMPGTVLLIRLAHRFAPGEHTVLSQPAIVDINRLMSSITRHPQASPFLCKELSISGNQPIENVHPEYIDELSAKEIEKKSAREDQVKSGKPLKWVRSRYQERRGLGTTSVRKVEIYPLDVRTFACYVPSVLGEDIASFS